jgi:myo-inositol-1(or 4)-monophosphatase
VTESEESTLLAVAHEAADAAAAELRGRFGHHVAGVHTKSSSTDLVSEADLAAESAIRAVLAERRPQDAILGEEGGATGPNGAAPGADGALRWIVDPLDGTINFLFGIPQFAVSVACEDSAGTVVGVVLDPVRDERFAATRSGEPTLNGQRIEGSERAELSTAMVATGFGYDAAIRARQGEVVARVLPRVRDIRRAGAAALDLTWCACGRYDAYYERGLHNWDVAAGSLIAERAGLVVRELPATVEDPWGLACAPVSIIEEFIAIGL